MTHFAVLAPDGKVYLMDKTICGLTHGPGKCTNDPRPGAVDCPACLAIMAMWPKELLQLAMDQDHPKLRPFAEDLYAKWLAGSALFGGK